MITSFMPSKKSTYDYSEISNAPQAIPADGGNADTVNGKTSTEIIEVSVDSIEIGAKNYATAEKIRSISDLYNQFVQLNTSHSECPRGFFAEGHLNSSGVIDSVARIDGVIFDDGLWTVSFDAKGDESKEFTLQIDICDGTIRPCTISADNTWSRYYITANVSTHSILPSVFTFVDFAIPDARCYIRNIQVERGNKATDYRIAEDDYYTKSQIDASAELFKQNAPLMGQVAGNFITLENTQDGMAIVEIPANLLSYPFDTSSLVKNGVTFTDNEDGTITVNGTATAKTSFAIKNRKAALPFRVKDGTYTLSGCPSGGSTSSFYMNMQKANAESVVLEYGKDTGHGMSYNIALDEDSDERIQVQIIIANGFTANNLVFKPMFERGDVVHNFVQYGAKVYSSTRNLFDIKDLANSTNAGTGPLPTVSGNDFTVFNSKDDLGPCYGDYFYKLFPNVHTGMRLKLNFENVSSSDVVNEIYLNGTARDWMNGSSLTISEADINGMVYFYAPMHEYRTYRNMRILLADDLDSSFVPHRGSCQVSKFKSIMVLPTYQGKTYIYTDAEEAELTASYTKNMLAAYLIKGLAASLTEPNIILTDDSTVTAATLSSTDIEANTSQLKNGQIYMVYE